MSEPRKIGTICGVAPWMQTEEFARKFNAAAEQRNQADFECFRVLRDINDHLALDTPQTFARIMGIKYPQIDEDLPLQTLAKQANLSQEEVEDIEFCDYLAEQVREVLEKRREADRAFSEAMTKPRGA